MTILDKAKATAERARAQAGRWFPRRQPLGSSAKADLGFT